MKRVMSVAILMLIILQSVCVFGWEFPAYDGANQHQATVTERINVVFDNSGHSDVKAMMRDVMIAAVISENSNIWIYPIAGNNQPILVEPTKEFIESFYTLYSKSSNEFKPENVVDVALTGLLEDTTVTDKRLILYANYQTRQIREEYDVYDGLKPYFKSFPGVKYTIYNSNGVPQDSFDVGSNGNSNYEYMSSKCFHEFMLVKNGYSQSEASYDDEKGVISIGQGKGDNNIFVLADENARRNASLLPQTSSESGQLYLGGCMMGTGAYEEYQKKNKVKGVSLSYHHVIADGGEGDGFAAALFTADGETVNPTADTMHIPLLNASKVSVYHRSAKGVGVCSAETTYDSGQDKKQVNVNAPQETEVSEETSSVIPERVLGFSSVFENEKEEQSVFKKIISTIGRIIGIIIGIIFKLIRILLLVFVILLIVHRKFRSYVQIKILGTKFGPTYEKTVIKVKKIFADIAGAGAKIRGNADLKDDFIFISKASADMAAPNNRITLVVRELESRGIKCWLSETGIKPGQDYNVILPEAIKSCKLFLLFVSPMAVKSSDVVSEIGTAKEHKKTIIPVQIEPFDLFKEFPNWAYMLKQYQKTDLFRSKEDEIKALADHIEQTFRGII